MTAPDAHDVDDEHTLVVDRMSSTVAPDEDEHTVVVDRTSSTAAGDEDEHTVVVDRKGSTAAGDEDEHTVVVDRKSSTVAPDEDEHTVVVDRKGKQSSLQAPAKGRRRGIAPPPVPTGFAPAPVEAAGAGAVEQYSPRMITLPPASAELLEEGPAPTRVATPAMASVHRRGRITARVAMGVFVASCVVAVLAVIAIVWRFV